MKAPVKLHGTDEETWAERSRGKSVSGKDQNSVILCSEGRASFLVTTLLISNIIGL